MGATTYPHSDTISTRTADRTIDESKVATGLLAVGAVDALLLGLLTLTWIFDPATAPSWTLVLATPLMALATLRVPSLLHARVAHPDRAGDLLVSTARWWSLFALLLSLPAILIVGSL